MKRNDKAATMELKQTKDVEEKKPSWDKIFVFDAYKSNNRKIIQTTHNCLFI